MCACGEGVECGYWCSVSVVECVCIPPQKQLPYACSAVVFLIYFFGPSLFFDLFFSQEYFHGAVTSLLLHSYSIMVTIK